MEQPSRIFLGLGSNEGDRIWFLNQALETLNERLPAALRRVSSVYETEPVGFDNQGWFLNAAAELSGTTSPQALLSVIQDIEIKLERRRIQRWGPRTIDIDILFFGDQIIREPGLEIPHPRLRERRFVLEPLNEIDSNWIYPGTDFAVGQLLRLCEDEHIVRKFAPSSVLWSGAP